MKTLLSKTSVVLALTGFLLGSIGGFWLRSARMETPEMDVAAQTGSINRFPETREISEPVRVEIPPEEEPTQPLNEIDYEEMFARLEAEGLRLVPKKVLFHLIRNPIRPGQPVLPLIAEALRLSPTEVERAETVLKTIEKELAALEADRTERISVDDNNVTFRIHPFPADGGNLRNRLQSDLTEIVGETKGNIFAELIDEHGAYYDGFGAAPLTVWFRVWDYEGQTRAGFSSVRITDDDTIPVFEFHWNPNQPVTAGRHSHLLRQLPPEMRAHFAEPQ